MAFGPVSGCVLVGVVGKVVVLFAGSGRFSIGINTRLTVRAAQDFEWEQPAERAAQLLVKLKRKSCRGVLLSLRSRGIRRCCCINILCCRFFKGQQSLRRQAC